jgi:uncharacterized membrane protein YfcA
VEYIGLLGYAVLGLGAGTLIGCVGIGGVIVVPALVYLAGLPVPTAIAAAMGAFVVSGAIGLYAYAKAGSIRWSEAAWASLGALPCAFAGALAVPSVPAPWLELAIGVLASGTGLYVLAERRARRAERARLPGAPALTGIGAAAGVVSALTGTGGPLAILPALLALGAPTLAALGVAQAIQLPIAAAATAGHWLVGSLDLSLTAALAAGIALGTWQGARAAHALPTAKLRTATAVVLVLVGGAILVRLVAV